MNHKAISSVFKRLKLILLYCLVFGAVLACGYLICYLHKENDPELTTLKNNIKILEDNINEKQRQNIVLDKEIKYYKRQADTNRHLLRSSLKAIDKLKKRKHEKIVVLNSLNVDGLYGFFSKFNSDSSDTE